MTGVAVVGAGRIGIPWAVVLAVEVDIPVTCIDIDEKRVEKLNNGIPPFAEPELERYLREAIDRGNFNATTNKDAVRNHEYVALTVNAPRGGMSDFVDLVEDYAGRLVDRQVVVARTTLPVDMVSTMWEVVDTHAEGSPTFTTFPERLAEGKAIDEIKSLPKIVGVMDDAGRTAMHDLLEGLNCPIRFTDVETAMFVKLIDNSYRDALFAISNQIAFTSDQLGLNAHEAIELANYEYPRNEIPGPGPVGGKCLPKDPHFLTDEWVCDQPTTPDLFSATRRTNSAIPSYVLSHILRQQPDDVAILGVSYKSGVGDTYNSPAMWLAEELMSLDISVSVCDPNVDGTDPLDSVLDGSDTIILAMNHQEFEGIEPDINEFTDEEAVVYDLWHYLDDTKLDRSYSGFGVAE